MNDLLTTKYMNVPERAIYRNVHSSYTYNNNQNSENKYLQLKHFINELNKVICLRQMYYLKYNLVLDVLLKTIAYFEYFRLYRMKNMTILAKTINHLNQNCF
jgi:hypothetical protein